MRLAMIALAALCLGGCWQTESRTSYRIGGTAAGQPVELIAQGASASDSGLDPVATLAAAVAAMRGDLVGVRDAIKAQPVPQPPVPAAEIASAVVAATPPAPSRAPEGVAALVALAGGALAYRQKTKEADFHKADAADAYARLLPPTKATP